jgi:RNA polymerase sigma-70 factor, ECF subfamily
LPDVADDETPERKPSLAEERRERLAQLVQRRTRLTESEALLLRQVFPAIYHAHHGQVWNQLRTRGRDRADVEDLVQEAFEILFEDIVEHGFPDSIPRYLHKIAEFRLLNHLRDRKRSPLSVGLPSSGEEPPRTPPQPERTLDVAQAAHLARAEISDEQWSVVDLVILAGLSYEEAAATLDIPIPTLKSRLLTAKKVIHRVVKRFLPPSQR